MTPPLTPVPQPLRTPEEPSRQWLGWGILLSLLLLGGGSVWWMREQALVANRDQRQEQTLRLARRTAQQGDLLNALRLLRDLEPDSPAGKASQSLRRLWTEQLIEQARQAYHQGQLESALALLAKLPADDVSPDAAAIARTWRRDWDQDAVLLTRIRQEIAQARWWEVERTAAAVSANPYWQRQARALADQARQVIGKLAATPLDHPAPPSNQAIPDAQLEPLFNRFRRQGQDEFTAWSNACREAGGKVVDEGPETWCGRQ